MRMVITIDTEADNQWAPGNRLTTHNIDHLPRFQALCEARGLGRRDSLATAAALTAATVAKGIERFVPAWDGGYDIFVTGGGVHNPTIMDELRRRLGGAEIRPIDDLGIPADAKEAVDFALLARETLCGRPGALAQVTGASRDSIVGTIAPGGGA